MTLCLSEGRHRDNPSYCVVRPLRASASPVSMVGDGFACRWPTLQTVLGGATGRCSLVASMAEGLKWVLLCWRLLVRCGTLVVVFS
jgi:hypothetical protein